jgi:hypothetical protein
MGICSHDRASQQADKREIYGPTINVFVQPRNEGVLIVCVASNENAVA